MQNKTKKIALALSVAVAMGVVAFTYAYWSESIAIDNPFSTASYGTTVIEEFSPEDGEEWEPGATVDKIVAAENTGDYDVVVRASLSETWTFSTDSTKTIVSTTDATDGDADEGASTGGNDVMDIYETYQEDAGDGYTDGDGSVVIKNIGNTDEDVAGYWIDAGDGWYYYSVALAPGESTVSWLQSVTLLEDADMGLYTVTYYATTVEDYDDVTEADWVVYTSDAVPAYIGYDATDANTAIFYYSEEAAVAAASTDGATITYAAVTYNKGVSELSSAAKGYSDSDYVLTVTVETVQATADAVIDTWGEDAVLDTWNLTTEDDA